MYNRQNDRPPVGVAVTRDRRRFRVYRGIASGTLAAAVLFPSLTWSWSSEPGPYLDAQEVSLIQLIANPAAFHGTKVRVFGFVEIELEGEAVYLSRGDLEYGISKNALWLDVPAPVRADAQRYQGRLCLIEGIFDQRDTGHLGLFSGSITRITRVENWEPIEGAAPSEEPQP